MPIGFDIEPVRQQFGCVNYFETGLWDPRDDISSKRALKCGFDKVFCVELREDWVNLGKEVFKDEISTGRYSLILDDSSNMKNHLTSEFFDSKTMFFLDAHVDTCCNSRNYIKICPLFNEIEAIKSLTRKDNVIMIDDLRIITTMYPWGETTYGNIDFLRRIKNQILEINSEYKFGTLDGCIPNDVLIAYV